VTPESETGFEKVFVALALALTLVLRIATLAPEVEYPRVSLNDMILHDAAIRAASEAMARGESPLDSWLAPIAVGYPFLRQYQPAAHVATAAVHRLLFGAVDPFRLRAIFTVLALAAFPFAVYRAARDMGLDRVGATVAAAASPLLEAPLLMGLTDQAYVWRGYGLYSQALGSVLFVFAVGASARAVETGRGAIRAGFLIGGALVTHFIFGWLAAMLAGALAVTSRAPLLRRARALATAGLVAGASSAFIILPAVRTAAYANQSRLVADEAREGYGFDKTLRWTLNGRMLDGDVDDATPDHAARRIPVISLLAAAGIAAGLARRRLPFVPGGAAGRAGVILAVSVVLLGGRIAFGDRMEYVPGAKYLHLQRMIAGAHLAAMLFVGVAAQAFAGGAGALAAWLRAGPRVVLGARLAAGLLALGALAPAVIERVDFARGDGEMAKNAEEGVEADADVNRALDVIRQRPPGRIYAGHNTRPAMITHLAGNVPLDGLLVAHDLPTLGHLYHPYAVASDVSYFEFDPEREADADCFGIRYFMIPAAAPQPPGTTLVERAGKIAIYERAAGSYFAIVSAPRRIDVEPSKAYDAAVAWCRSPERPLGVAPLFALAREAWEPAGPADRRPRGQITNESSGAGRYDVEVTLEEPGYVLAKIGYHPSLGAIVDGAPAEVACVVPGFPAVRLEPGFHTVSFFVAPDRTRWLLALAGVLAIAAAVRFERRYPVFRAKPPAGEAAAAGAPQPPAAS
jgi:hypothetical protein